MTSIVRLNVGGTRYTTSLSTLLSIKGSMLERMFSNLLQADDDDETNNYESNVFGLEKDQDGYYFIDRDGPSFRYILLYLRDGEFSNSIIIPDDKQERLIVEKEADCYLLPQLVSACHLNAERIVPVPIFTEYKVLAVDIITESSEHISDYVKEGWSLVGGVASECFGNEYCNGIGYQALAR